jgi:hypothetical protein
MAHSPKAMRYGTPALRGPGIPSRPSYWHLLQQKWLSFSSFQGAFKMNRSHASTPQHSSDASSHSACRTLGNQSLTYQPMHPSASCISLLSLSVLVADVGLAVSFSGRWQQHKASCNKKAPA